MFVNVFFPLGILFRRKANRLGGAQPLHGDTLLFFPAPVVAGRGVAAKSCSASSSLPEKSYKFRAQFTKFV
ncbi:MAG: hypothetical protein WCO86_18280, partial [Planctomycetota bacterium]